ncbi:MAG: type II toxin-antitoxin system Phd/YefM family antitoxin [bacterium]
MKRVTASEARRNWFRILDEVAAGATVVVERAGRKILIQRAEESEREDEIPEYGKLLSVREPERADEWGWEWGGPEGEVVPSEDQTEASENDVGPSEGEAGGE